MRVLGLTLIWLLAAGAADGGEVGPGLARLVADTAPLAPVRVLVVLQEQVDVPALTRELAAAKTGHRRRHELVAGSLQETAAATQPALLAHLRAEQSRGRVLGFTPHWLINAVYVVALPAAIADLAERPEVARVEPDLVPELIAPVAEWAPPAKTAAGIGLVPGVAAIGAPRVWRELGIDGTGTLVGVIDTGVDGTHPAYSARWQGLATAPAFAWLDAAGLGYPDFPVDLQGHGTHVLGTMIGLAPGDTIGVAPGARWLASNAIQASAVAFDNAILAALEFMADPDGDPATSDDVPDVVQNSWGVNETFAGYLDCDSRWWSAIDNCEAAGVVLVWAAGNEGPNAGTLRTPADRATSPYNCFAVGSTGHAEPFPISSFSSRGPSGCGGTHAVKPEITAPGDSIYSARAGGSYRYRSGTSMAGPHVAGVVALMRQANPDVDVATIKDILLNTARDLGAAGEDNTYGRGLVDAYAAVQAVMGGIGTVSGVLTAADTGQPVAGAAVSRVGGENRSTSNPAGVYSLTMYAGPTDLRITAFGYRDTTISVVLPDGGLAVADVALTRTQQALLSGVVRGPDLLPVAGATVSVVGAPVLPAVTDSLGRFEQLLPAAPEAPYAVRAAAPGLGYQVQNAALTADQVLDFLLPELTLEDFESGGFLAYPWQFGGNRPWQVDTNQVHEGALSARSGPLQDNETSVLTIDYYVAAAGELSFWYRVSTEHTYDFLRFAVDGQVKDEWSGEVGWSRYDRQVAAGHHTFSWVYAKDEAVAQGLDAVWVDLITFPVTGVPPAARLEVTVPSVFVVLNPDSTATRPVMLGNTGNLPLDYTLSVTPPGGSGPVPWVQAAPAAGTVPIGGTAVVDLVFTAQGLALGNHVAVLNIASNDPDVPLALVPLILNVVVASAAPEPDLPRRVTLSGAVPNPFNPQTMIRYGLPRAAAVQLRLFDVQGRLVRSLVTAELPAGDHAAPWDGRDDRGRAVASGTYFARLVVGTERLVVPLTLVR